MPNENEPALAPVDVIHRGSIAARFRNPDSEPYLFNVLDRLERTHKMAILSASVSNTDAFVRHKIALECLQEIRGTIAADADMGKRAGERLHRGK